MGLTIGGKVYNGVQYIQDDQFYVPTGYVSADTGETEFVNTFDTIHDLVGGGLYRLTLKRLRGLSNMRGLLVNVPEATDSARVLIDVPDDIVVERPQKDVEKGLAAFLYLRSFGQQSVNITPTITKAINIVTTTRVPLIKYNIGYFSFKDNTGKTIPNNSEALVDDSVVKELCYNGKPAAFLPESIASARHIYIEGYGYTVSSDDTVVYLAGIDSKDLNVIFNVTNGYNAFHMIYGRGTIPDVSNPLPTIVDNGVTNSIGWDRVPYTFCQNPNNNTLVTNVPYRPEIFTAIGEAPSYTKFTLPNGVNFNNVGANTSYQEGFTGTVATEIYPQGIYNLIYTNGGYVNTPTPYSLLTLNTFSAGDGCIQQTLTRNYLASSSYNPRYHRYYYIKGEYPAHTGFTGWYGNIV